MAVVVGEESGSTAPVSSWNPIFWSARCVQTCFRNPTFWSAICVQTCFRFLVKHWRSLPTDRETGTPNWSLLLMNELITIVVVVMYALYRAHDFYPALRDRTRCAIGLIIIIMFYFVSVACNADSHLVNKLSNKSWLTVCVCVCVCARACVCWVCARGVCVYCEGKGGVSLCMKHKLFSRVTCLDLHTLVLQFATRPDLISCRGLPDLLLLWV